MAKIIATNQLGPDDLSPMEQEWVYNGLDCCITDEVLDALLPQLDNQTGSTYSFSRALQGPVLEMGLRGVRIDATRKAQVLEEYFDRLDQLERQLERIVWEGVGFIGFNWRSPSDLKALFYDRLRIPEIRSKGRVTVDRNALEKLEAYHIARPIVAHMLALRDLGKKVGVLKTAIDPDGRMRTSYNIAGTETGRFSSSLSEFGTGTNLQNIEDLLRSIFIADKRMKLAYLDAKQGESRVVGAIEYNVLHDARYLDACEGGDLHTEVAKLCWPELAWTGDARSDKDLAEQPYYRHHSRRFMCKKIGHGSNYGGKPRTLALQAKVPIGVIEDFQPKYFRAFPHLEWHEYVKEELRRSGILTSLTGRRRHFWGRRDSNDTLRAAIAYDPQGSLADIVNAGMYNLWQNRDAQLLMQNHDAVVVQYPEHLEDEIIPKLKKQLEFPIELRDGRKFVIPYDCKTGWNWGEFDGKRNPDGLKEWHGGDTRKRGKEMSLLDRRIR